MSKKVKIFVIVIAVIAVIILAVSFFGKSTPASTDTSLSTNVPSTTVLPGGGGGIIAADTPSQFSALLSATDSISLDTSLFSDPGYLALRDNPVNLGTAVIGRVNPFAPIGSDAANPTQQTLQVETLAPDKVVSTSAEFGALISAALLSPTTVVFEYGTSNALGQSTTSVNVTNNGTALFTATGLTAATTYYVEAVAVQGSSTTTGNIMSFTTAALAQ